MAAGGNQRGFANLYPWGDKWEPEYANHAGGVNSPTVVGLYPAGMTAQEVDDMRVRQNFTPTRA